MEQIAVPLVIVTTKLCSIFSISCMNSVSICAKIMNRVGF